MHQPTCRRVVLYVCALALTLPRAYPAANFLALKDIKAGMHGVGKTVFSGDRIEDFQVEILGVLENIGPKESLILARLSGGPLGSAGVMQGMSGSPVYIDGKLIGAVAMAVAYRLVNRAGDPLSAARTEFRAGVARRPDR